MKYLVIPSCLLIVLACGCENDQSTRIESTTKTSWKSTENSLVEKNAPIPNTVGNWSMDAPTKNIPDQPLTGSIWGRTLDTVTCRAGGHALRISIASEDSGRSEGELIIFVGSEELVPGKEIVVTPRSTDMSSIPHIHMTFAKEGEFSYGTLMYVGEYTMRLNVMESNEERIIGKIHLSLPDYKLTHVIGRFEASKD